MTAARAAVALLAAVAAGCGPAAPPRVERHPVRGEVMSGGKPAAGAVVVLHAADQPPGRRPNAVTGPDGTFRLGFYTQGDGAPAGEYAVTVTWPTHLGMPAPDRLNGRFADPKSPAARFTVAAGDNVIPRIDLDK